MPSDPPNRGAGLLPCFAQGSVLDPFDPLPELLPVPLLFPLDLF